MNLQTEFLRVQNIRHHSPDSAGSSPSHRPSSQLSTHSEGKPAIPVSTGVQYRQSLSGPPGPASGRPSVSGSAGQGFSGFNPLIYGNDVDSVDVATRIAMVILYYISMMSQNFYKERKK